MSGWKKGVCVVSLAYTGQSVDLSIPSLHQPRLVSAGICTTTLAAVFTLIRMVKVTLLPETGLIDNFCPQTKFLYHHPGLRQILITLLNNG